MAADIGRRALLGGLTTAGGNLLAFFLRFGANLLLARTIGAEHFGTYAWAAIFAGALGLIQSFNFSQALLQLGDRPGLFVTTRRLSFLLAGGGAVLGLIAAPIIAAFTSPAVAHCFLGLALVQALTASASCYEALLQRGFRFHLVASLKVVAVFISVAVVLPLGYLAPGPFVLVVRDAVPPLISIGVVAWVSRRSRLYHEPGISGPYDKRTAREVFRLGAALFGARAVEFAFHRVDSLVVGAALGDRMLGCYEQARYIAGLPAAAIAPFGMTVGLRTFSAVQDDPRRLARAFELTQWAIARFGTVFAVGTLIAPDLAVRIVCGPAWDDAIEMLRAMTPWLVFAPLVINQQMLLTAVHDWPPLRLSFVLGAALLTALAFPLKAVMGPPGVALAASIGYASISVMLLFAARRHTRVPFRALLPPMLALVIAAAAGIALRMLVLTELNPMIAAGLATLVGLVVGVASLLLLEGRHLRAEVAYLREVIRRRSAA